MKRQRGLPDSIKSAVVTLHEMRYQGERWIEARVNFSGGAARGYGRDPCRAIGLAFRELSDVYLSGELLINQEYETPFDELEEISEDGQET